MSAVTNSQIANAFRVARKRLLDGRNPFICIALYGAGAGADEARYVIENRMQSDGRTHALEDWLKGRGIDVDIDEMLDYRIRWLDALIEEFDPAEGSGS